MIEKDFHPYIVKSLIRRGQWCYKLPDDMGGSKFSLKRPFDLIANIRSKSVAIEVKLIKGYKAFGLRHFQDHQPIELEKHGRSFVFLVIWEPRDTRLIIFDWNWLYPVLKSGSLKKSQLLEFDYIKCFKQDFDFSSFINSIHSPNPSVQL